MHNQLDDRELGEAEGFVIDGRERFSDRLRRILYDHVNQGTTPQEEVIAELRRLTDQEYPSSQAEYFLNQLREKGLTTETQVPHQDYDEVVGQAWLISTVDVQLAQEHANHVGAFLDAYYLSLNNRMPLAPPDPAISEQLVP